MTYTPEELKKLRELHGKIRRGLSAFKTIPEQVLAEVPGLIDEIERLKAEPVGCHGCTHVLCEDECELCAE